MAGRGGEFPIGKALSFFVVLALTVLPVVSCGPIDFKGHEILRNEPPDVTGFTDQLDQGLLGLRDGMTKQTGESSTPTKAGAGEPKRDTLFPPGQTWMWLLYVTVFGAGILSFFAPSGNRGRVAIGLYGAVGLLLFLTRFQTALMGDGDASAAGLSVIKWDAGAYIGLVSFALILFDGLRVPAGTGRVID